MASKKHFVFDAYGTLFKINSNSEKIQARANGKSEEIQTLWRSRQLQYTWLRSLMDHWVDFDKVTEEALDFALKTYAINEDVLKKLLLDIYKSPDIFDDVKPFLSSLKAKGAKTAILSNGTKALLDFSARKVDISDSLTAILSADQARLFKPSPKVYSLVTKEFECLPQEVTFFSSNAWDIAGASKFGFKTVWINRSGTHYEELGVQPDFVFDNLRSVSLDELMI